MHLREPIPEFVVRGRKSGLGLGAVDAPLNVGANRVVVQTVDPNGDRAITRIHLEPQRFCL